MLVREDKVLFGFEMLNLSLVAVKPMKRMRTKLEHMSQYKY